MPTERGISPNCSAFDRPAASTELIRRCSRLVAQWKPPACTEQRAFCRSGRQRLAELRPGDMAQAPGASPKMLMEISDFLRRAATGQRRDQRWLRRCLPPVQHRRAAPSVIRINLYALDFPDGHRVKLKRGFAWIGATCSDYSAGRIVAIRMSRTANTAMVARRHARPIAK